MEYLTREEIKKVFEYLDEEDLESISKMLKDSSLNVNIDEMNYEQEEEFEEKLYKCIASRINKKDYDDLLENEVIEEYYLKNVIIATNNSEIMEKCVEYKKDKLSIEDVLNKVDESETIAVTSNASNEIQAEAVQALVALGYGNTESMKAVKKVEMNEDTTVEEVLKLALRNMMF